MKTKAITLITLSGAVTFALAVGYFPFRDWNWIKDKSADIAIVRCVKTPKQFVVETNGTISSYKDGMIMSDIEVELVLKGMTNPSSVRLFSLYWPRQGEHYLIFSHFDGGVYSATEEYRIIPLGVDFSTNSVTGKSLDEQIQFLLQYRLNNLNRELERGQEEKKRLEEGLKK